MSGRGAVTVLLALLCCHVDAAGAASVDSFQQRMQPCESCHGKEGRPSSDGYYPRIAGKPAGYLYEQLLNFRDGRRVSPMMTYMVDRQSEAYLRQMAEYFSKLEFPYAPPDTSRRSAALLAQGEQLVRHGDASRNLPACTACHGERLTGIAPAVPGLLGLPQYYLAAQLGAWREGLRQARAPDCMADIARRLTPADLEAVSAWLAAQPVPADARAPTMRLKPPVTCGSLEPRP
jgi:cytochrome c553